MSPRRFSTKIYRQAQSSHERAGLPRPKGRKRSLAERMNKGEQRYAESLDVRPDVAAWWYEGMSWRLADDTRYVPDFVVLLDDGTMELHEVKGSAKGGADFGATELSWAKIKVAAEMCPFPVVVVWQDRGTWRERRLGSVDEESPVAARCGR
jgi:hypothetical protein